MNYMAKFQDKVKRFMKENKMNNPIEYCFLDLVSELGEVAKEIIKMSNYGTKKPKFKKEIIGELGDVFYSLITVANHYNVDLEDALNMILEKYNKRIKTGGHSGSENE
jgi:NTP pyrophosphatase (non-canonical NTP hydrolase)